MRLSKRGMFRDCGATELIRPTDDVTIQVRATPPELLVRINASRGDGASYYYYLRLSPTEVLRHLLTLRAETIPAAMEELQDEFDLSKLIPELQRQLSIGSFAAAQLALATVGAEENEDEDTE